MVTRELFKIHGYFLNGYPHG